MVPPMSTTNSDSLMGVARTVSALRARMDAWRADGQKMAFVPTMGALHDGHLSLVTHGARHADKVVASIFVNPAQFAPDEDLETYPREEIRDLELLQSVGCDLAYVPPAEEMYPPGFQTAVAVKDISQGLCGDSRPHFFGGVVTVVCKLLNQCRPDFAVFGEKDYQQLLVIRRMVCDLDMDVEIIGAPIVREDDGLAMSSRNVYLSDDERVVAGELNKALAVMAIDLEGGATVERVLANGRTELEKRGFTEIDYLEIRCADDLSKPQPGPATVTLRILAAAMVGKTRLIDNWPVEI